MPTRPRAGPQEILTVALVDVFRSGEGCSNRR